jgi:SAM-dependent methyltransferase
LIIKCSQDFPRTCHQSEMNGAKRNTSRRFRFYNELAPLYDFICTPEDRKRDVVVLKKIIRRHLRSNGKSLLDVACGTGLEDKYLKRSFSVTGLDLNNGVLRIARKRNPEVTYLRGNMRDFRLNRTYDVITCFDAMCYLRGYRELRKTLKNFHRHLKPGGLLIFYIDPVFLKEHSKQDTIIVNRKTLNRKTIILFEVYHKYHDSVKGYAAYLIVEGDHASLKQDTFETLGFFGVRKILQILQDLGFRTYLYSTGKTETFSLRKYNRRSSCPVFACEKRF